MYEQVGVKEYWLVDPIDSQVEIYTLRENTFEKIAASLVLQGLELRSETIFADDFGEDFDEQ
jgi:Uma2 family endonuclease